MVKVYTNHYTRLQTRSAGARAKEAVEITKSGRGKTLLALSALASGRYQYRRDARRWELALSKRLMRLANPRVTGI
jgi:hypothetical protein